MTFLIALSAIIQVMLGDRLDADFTKQFITTGVDMFLIYHRRRGRRAEPAFWFRSFGSSAAKGRKELNSAPWLSGSLAVKLSIVSRLNDAIRASKTA
ncbi:hypothetical protein ACWCOT_04300 [Nonomuraea bangladeshensis]